MTSIATTLLSVAVFLPLALTSRTAAREVAASGGAAPVHVGGPAAGHDTQEVAGSRANYPEFSWDRVPCWVRVRKDIDFTAEETAHLATYPVIVFEKATGFRSHGDVETGTLFAAQAVKRVNPRAKTFFYWNAVIEYGNYRANEEFDRNADRWAFHKIGRKEVFKFKDLYSIFDLTNPAMQDWWVRTACQMAAHEAIDGIFIDAICKAGPITEGGPAKSYPIYDLNKYSQGYWEMASKLRNSLGRDTLVLGNAIRVSFPNYNMDHLRYMDGSYLERWSIPMGTWSYEDYVAAGIGAMQDALAQGKIVLFSCGPEAFGREGAGVFTRLKTRDERLAWMKDSIDYPLAVFLIVAERHAYFDWASGADAKSEIWRNEHYPQLHRALGAPLGRAQRDGYVYSRRFEHVDVTVDIRKKVAELRWR